MEPTAETQTTFPLRMGHRGRPSQKYAVVVGDELQIVHPLLKQLMDVPLDDIGAVVRRREVRPEQMPLLRRTIRSLDLSSDRADANLVLCFRQPAPCGPFKYGANNRLPINGKERRRGVEVDSVALTVDDPDGLCARLVELGVRPMRSEAEALMEVIGLAPTADRERRAAEERRRAGWARIKFVMMGVAWIGLVWVKALGGGLRGVSTSGLIGWTVVAAAGWATAIAVGMALVRRDSRPVRDRANPIRTLVLPIAGLGAGFIATGLLAGWSAPFGYGLLGGAPAGFFWGIALQSWRLPRADASAHGLSG